MTDHPMHIPDAELEAQISSSHTQDQRDLREREEAANPATTAVHIPQRTYHHPTVASESESASAETRSESTRHASPRPCFAPGIPRIHRVEEVAFATQALGLPCHSAPLLPVLSGVLAFVDTVGRLYILARPVPFGIIVPTISWGQEELERELETSVLEACLSGRGWDALCPEFRRVYQWDVGEVHAHCTQNADCPFKESYIEAVSQITADGKLIRSLHPGAYPAVSQAHLLGRHEQCTCPITRTAPGMPPSRPDHEKIFEQFPFDTPRVERLHDDRYLLLDHPLRVWSVLQFPPRATHDDDAQLGDLSLPSVIASGTLTPFPAGTPTPLAGITCPCYDEVHGSGAALKAQAELASRLAATATATSPPSAILDTPNNNNSSNTEDVSKHPFSKARAAIARRYRAAFPWLDPVALAAKVTQDCYRLADEYEHVLRGSISDDEIIAFYASEAFAADGCHEDVEREKHERERHESQRHADPGGGGGGERDVFCPGAAVVALEHKYAHGYPWMSPRFVGAMAGGDARWLQKQALARGPGKRLLADRQIIGFFGAEKWV
ncbi:hypothetical protein LZ554_008063 [Drepanopeziza brunnea f. sp. 'monogermtubi']|nr:hypothetical protein LZ554_008063 [Drepanopeziza brunnea f. sp. 'monogermtubi']